MIKMRPLREKLHPVPLPDPATQQTVWTATPIPSNAAWPAIAPNGDVVLFEYGSLTLYDYDGATGNLRWTTA